MSRYQSPTRGTLDDDCFLQERALTTLMENKKMLMQTDRTLAKSQENWTRCGPEYIPFDIFQKQMAIKEAGRRRSNSPKATWQSGSRYGNGANPRQSSPYGTSSQANNCQSFGNKYSSGNLGRESPGRLPTIPPNEGFSRRQSTSPQKKNYSCEGQTDECKGYKPCKPTSEKTKDTCEISNSVFPEISQVPEMSPERKRQHRSQSRSRAFAHSEFSNNSPVQHNFDDDECGTGLPTEREVELNASVSDVSLSLSEPPSLSKYLSGCGSTTGERPKTPQKDWVQKYLHRKSKYQRALGRLMGGTEEACRKKAAEEDNKRCQDANTKPDEKKDLFDSIQKDRGSWFLYRREYQQFFNDGGDNQTCNATSGRERERISSPGLAKIILGSFNPAGEGKARETGYANAIQLRTTSSVPGMQLYSSKQHDACNSAVTENVKNEKQNAVPISVRTEAKSPLKAMKVESPKQKTVTSTEKAPIANSVQRVDQKGDAIIKQNQQIEQNTLNQKDTDQLIKETMKKKQTTLASPRKITPRNTTPSNCSKSPSKYENKSSTRSPRKQVSVEKTSMNSTTANVMTNKRSDRSRSKSPSKPAK